MPGPPCTVADHAFPMLRYWSHS